MTTSNKTLAIFLTILLAFSHCRKVNTDFLNLISTSSSIKATDDAIKAVLQLLNDLKGANQEVQSKAEKFFKEYQNDILEDLGTFTTILNQNKASMEASQEDLEAVDDKIQQTKDYLDWNEQRRSQNQVKLEQLAEQRCEANSLFIDTLREYRQAIEVLDWIHGNIESKEKNLALIEGEDLNLYADKLNMYATLYKESAINEFVKLGENNVELVETQGIKYYKRQVNTADNQVSNEQLASSVVSDVIKKVQSLMENVKGAIKNLEDQEITSANDFVEFRNNLLKEQTSLLQEYDSKQKFYNSLANNKELAQDVVNQSKDIFLNTQRILQQTQDQYNLQKSQMEIEQKKRQEENQIIEEIILIYKNKITDAKQFLQEKVGGSFVQLDENQAEQINDRENYDFE